MQLERGVLFKSTGYSFIVPLAQTRGIVQGLSILPLPWTEDWLLGVAHLNGAVLPITDFRLFCTETPYMRMPKSESIMVFGEGEWLYGMLVNTLVGMRDFEFGPLSIEITKDLKTIESCLLGQTIVNDQECLILDIQKFLQIERFMNPVRFR